jgi:modulator of FtsH protease
MLGPAAWESFAVMTGGASAALTGLLFVAVSINRELIRDPQLRSSAAQTLVLLVVPVILCALLLIPNQDTAALSIELIVAGLLIGLILLRTRPHLRREERSALGELLDRRETMLTIAAFVLVGGISYWCGGGGGLYWLVPATLLAFVSGVINAWLFLINDTDSVPGQDH